eukprot:487150_1
MTLKSLNQIANTATCIYAIVIIVHIILATVYFIDYIQEVTFKWDREKHCKDVHYMNLVGQIAFWQLFCITPIIVLFSILKVCNKCWDLCYLGFHMIVMIFWFVLCIIGFISYSNGTKSCNHTPEAKIILSWCIITFCYVILWSCIELTMKLQQENKNQENKKQKNKKHISSFAGVPKRSSENLETALLVHSVSDKFSVNPS